MRNTRGRGNISKRHQGRGLKPKDPRDESQFKSAGRDRGFAGRTTRAAEALKREFRHVPKPQKVSLTKPENHFVIGRNAVLEALRHSGDRAVRVFCVDGDDSRLSEALKLASELDIKQIFVTGQALSDGVNSDSHQGIVLEMLPHLRLSIEQLCLEAESDPHGHATLVAVDGVTDPQNLGAIMRACECFGVRALIFSRNRIAPVTPTVTKASAGASELVSMVSVPNLAQALEGLKRSGYWVLATSLGEDAQPMSKVKLPEKTILVLGSEGRGVQRLVRERADYSVFIPMMGKIDSLNVSQAAATFLYEISRRCQLD